MTRPALGFIGLGLMGSAMVGRLLARGHAVTVTANRSRTGVEAVTALGATEVTGPRAVAAASDVVMICVDTSASVEKVMLGPDGVLAGLKPGSLVIDFGTSLPGSTRMLAKATAEAGSAYMDAPLGRTPAAAKEGRLNIMAAGSAEDFARARPLFDDLGENIFHVGPLGAGHTLKLVNNFVSMTIACTMAEAFAVADHAGLSRETVYAVLSAGPNHSQTMDAIKAQAIDGDPGRLVFSIANGRKDLGYYGAMVDGLGLPTLIGGATKTALGLAVAEGRGDRLVPEMVDWFADLYAGAK